MFIGFCRLPKLSLVFVGFRKAHPGNDIVGPLRGSTDGVHQDAVVVTHKGLVGRVERVNPTSAKVRLINDLNSSVGVRLQTEARTTGVLRGQSEGNSMVIAYIRQTMLDAQWYGNVFSVAHPAGELRGQLGRLPP